MFEDIYSDVFIVFCALLVLFIVYVLIEMLIEKLKKSPLFEYVLYVK